MTAVIKNPKPIDSVEMGEASFPASDPPAVWTWDIQPAPKPAAPGVSWAPR